MENKKSKLSVLTDGFVKENPVLVLLLGTCPTLAISTTVMGSIGMGVATTIVLFFSNIIISMLKNIIPDKIRIPAYITVIAGFVSIVQMLVKAYTPTINDLLGIYLPLIVVNCIILGRAEMFASKNSVIDSALDGLGMGIGFTIALIIMGSIRELIGSGTWFGIDVFVGKIDPMAIMLKAPGGFFVYGVIIAAVNYLTKDKSKQRESMGCGTDGCTVEKGEK